MNHTKTPWHIEFGENEAIFGINGSDDTYIIETDGGYYPPKIEDAKFIIKAVNNHDILLKALIEAEYFIRNSVEQCKLQEHAQVLTMIRKTINEVK